MDIDYITKLDFFLKQQNSTKNILDIENLFVVNNDNQSILKLKSAAYNLNSVKNNSDIELQQIWFNLFTKQVKTSVQKIKKTSSNSDE